MLFQGKIVTAGPRGNACRECGIKTKAPAVLLRVVGEFNRHAGFPKNDNFCAKCGAGKLEEELIRIKEMVSTLVNGPSEDSVLGSRKKKVI